MIPDDPQEVVQAVIAAYTKIGLRKTPEVWLQWSGPPGHDTLVDCCPLSALALAEGAGGYPSRRASAWMIAEWINHQKSADWRVGFLAGLNNSADVSSPDDRFKQGRLAGAAVRAALFPDAK